jgi:ribosomal protein L18E
MPLIRRLPKRGFNNAAFHKQWAIVNLDDLNQFKAGTVVNEQLLRESLLVRGNGAGIKILGNGELKHALTIEADKISGSAREKIDKAGGTITLRSPRPRREKGTAEETDVTTGDEASKRQPKAAKKASSKKSAAKSGAPSKKARAKKR